MLDEMALSALFARKRDFTREPGANVSLAISAILLLRKSTNSIQSGNSMFRGSDLNLTTESQFKECDFWEHAVFMRISKELFLFALAAAAATN